MARTNDKVVKRQRGKGRQKDPFGHLTWDDLELWAGSRIVERGRRYYRRGAVTDITRSEGGEVVAWVHGTDTYATKVTVQPSGELTAQCSCPYYTVCKHAVAVVLVYLDRLKNKEPIPGVVAGDPRLTVFSDQQRFDEHFEDDTGDLLDAERNDADEIRAPVSLRPYLSRMTKAELIALIGKIGSEYPEVWSLLEHRQQLSSGKPDKILAAVHAAIQKLSEPLWGHGDYGYAIPSVDLHRLQEQLDALLVADQADALVRLGPAMLQGAARTVEAEHEGDSAYDLASCLTMVFRALPRSTLSEVERIELAIDLALADEYSLCDEGLAAFGEQSYSRQAWRGIVERLEQRLKTDAAPPQKDDFSYRYRRDRLSDWAITAMEQAGCSERIIPLCEREARATGSYCRLVSYLLEAGRLEDAERWCKRGISAMKGTAPGVVSRLRETMPKIATRQGDPLRAVALKAEMFFGRPSLESFQTLHEAADRSGVVHEVDAWARHYLVTGQTPPGVRGRPRRRRKKDPKEPWPLPEPGLPPASSSHGLSAPMTEILIQLAIEAKKPEEVLHWYDQRRGSGVRGWSGSLDIAVAGAVQRSHPERTISIYQKQAEALIATVTPRGYQAAGRFLRRVKQMLESRGKTEQWSRYLETLREQNRRRPRCMDVLNRLATADRPIIDG
jgi:uncharacterized Zn finger protein